MGCLYFEKMQRKERMTYDLKEYKSDKNVNKEKMFYNLKEYKLNENFLRRKLDEEYLDLPPKKKTKYNNFTNDLTDHNLSLLSSVIADKTETSKEKEKNPELEKENEGLSEDYKKKEIQKENDNSKNTDLINDEKDSEEQIMEIDKLMEKIKNLERENKKLSKAYRKLEIEVEEKHNSLKNLELEINLDTQNEDLKKKIMEINNLIEKNKVIESYNKEHLNNEKNNEIIILKDFESNKPEVKNFSDIKENKNNTPKILKNTRENEETKHIVVDNQSNNPKNGLNIENNNLISYLNQTKEECIEDKFIKANDLKIKIEKKVLENEKYKGMVNIKKVNNQWYIDIIQLASALDNNKIRFKKIQSLYEKVLFIEKNYKNVLEKYNFSFKESTLDDSKKRVNPDNIISN